MSQCDFWEYVQNADKGVFAGSALNSAIQTLHTTRTIIYSGTKSWEGSWAIIFRRLFSKNCTFGSKSGTKSLVRRYKAKFTKTVPEHLKVCYVWLIKFKKQLMYV